MKNVDWKKVAVTAGAIGVGIALTVATGGLGAPVAMAIGGAASGAIISGYDAYSSGQRGWELVGSIAKGAGTGAISGLIGGQLMGAGAGLATNVTQNIGNQAVRQVAKIGVESAVETAIDTGIDLATGNKITGQTVAMNFAFNTFTNGAGSVSPKKAPKADVVTTKPKSGDVSVTRPRKDVTPVQQLALPGPNSKPVSNSQVKLPHPMDKANYSQKTYSNNFSMYGSQKYFDIAGYEIKTVDDLAQAIKNKDVSISDLPVEYINRDGNVLIQNTRTSQALTVAGVPRNQWHVTNNTGNPLHEKLLDEQLLRNKLTSEGISNVRRSGGTNNGK